MSVNLETDEDDSVDETISAMASAALAEWEAHDDAVSRGAIQYSPKNCPVKLSRKLSQKNPSKSTIKEFQKS